MNRLSQLLTLGVLLAAPSPAALYMKSQVHGTGPDDKPNEAVRMVFEGWFEDDRAVINVLESGNAAVPAGKIFVEGTTMTLYDPQENTCMPWDLQAMMRFAGAMMEAMGGMIQLDFGEPEIEVLERRGGETYLGRRVDYLKYRSRWTMSLKVPLMKKQTYDNSSLQELWYDESLRDELPAFSVFMDADSFTTGYEEMDNAIAASMPPVDGPVLKSYAVSTTTNQKGKEQTTTSTTEVTELDTSAADPPGGYAPPTDCQMVSAFPGDLSAGEEGDEEQPTAEEDKQGGFPKVKIGNPFKKKKDDG